VSVEVGELTQARFIRELKNRFLCDVELAGRIIECYVPSSCRLANFLELEGKNVFIKPTTSKEVRTQYALVAIPFKRSYLLLNSSLANRVIEDGIRGRRFSFLGKHRQVIKEHCVDGYKSDLFITGSSTIIEIKSIISTSQTATFPTVYSERAIKQLEALRELLQRGFKACYVIVSLNPYVKELDLKPSTKLFQALIECMPLGMLLKGYACRLRNGVVSICHEVKINIGHSSLSS
jgi:DNA-binding sugar fermentation-stimulating protein